MCSGLEARTSWAAVEELKGLGFEGLGFRGLGV